MIYLALFFLFLMIPAYAGAMDDYQKKYEYPNEILDKNSPFSDHLPISPYWQSLEDKSQAEKDDALKQLTNDIFGDCHYPLLRRNIYDALRIGANPNMQAGFGNYPLSSEVTMKNDIYLLELIIKKGANINCTSNAPIFFAKTKPIAELLLKHGANVHSKNKPWDDGLLSNAMMIAEDYELISLYKKYISPCDDISNHGHSPLHCLTIHNYNSDLKAARLFENLDPQEIIDLINLKNKKDQTVFDLLPLIGFENTKLQQYLKDRLKLAEIDKAQLIKNCSTQITILAFTKRNHKLLNRFHD